MTALTFGLEMRRSRVLAFWLAVVGAAYTGVIGAMYPIFVENTGLMEEYLKVFPKEFMAAFGMTGSLADPGVFFTTYIGSFIWPVLAAMGGIVLGTRPVAADIAGGWSEIALATPLTRTRALGAAIVCQAVILALVAAATVGGVLVAGVLVGAGFDAARFALGGVVVWLFACAIAGVTTFVGAATLSRSKTAGIVLGILIGMYLANVVAQLQPDLAWIGDFGAFKYLTVTELIDDGVMPWSSIAIFTITAVAGWVAALAVFRRRDLLA